MRRITLPLPLLFLAAPLSGWQDQGIPARTLGDSLRLPEAMMEALASNPGLQALRAMADATEERSVEAGTLPDPMLQVGAMNLGLPEFDAGMPASMLPTVQLTQTLPFFGKLDLRERMAEGDGRMARATVAEEEWRTRARVAGAFHGLRAVDQTLEVHRRTLELLEDFQSVARSLYASGAGRQGDVLRADVEVARMDAEIERVRALRATRAAELNALMGRPAEEPVASPALPALPATLPPLDSLLSWATESRPALARERESLDRARTGVELARKDYWPDFTVSAQYGRRGGPEARSMGGLMIGATLPIHSGSRQRPRLEAARALERHAAARERDVLSTLEAELRTELAELFRARRLMALYREEILPAAQANVSSSLAAYRVGEVEFATLVGAQLDVDRFEGEYLLLVADYGSALARLEAAMGRELPSAPPIPAGFEPENP